MRLCLMLSHFVNSGYRTLCRAGQMKSPKGCKKTLKHRTAPNSICLLACILAMLILANREMGIRLGSIL